MILRDWLGSRGTVSDFAQTSPNGTFHKGRAGLQVLFLPTWDARSLIDPSRSLGRTQCGVPATCQAVEAAGRGLRRQEDGHDVAARCWREGQVASGF